MLLSVIWLSSVGWVAYCRYGCKCWIGWLLLLGGRGDWGGSRSALRGSGTGSYSSTLLEYDGLNDFVDVSWVGFVLDLGY